MTGPYTAHIFLNVHPADAGNCEPDMTLRWDRDESILDQGARVADGFYRSGGGATKLGTLRAATFAVAILLDPGESAYVRLLGREPSTNREVAFADDSTVRRDDAGRVLSTLGSRWLNERHFNSSLLNR